MTVVDNAYEILRRVVDDSQEHPVSKIHEILNNNLGMNEVQSRNCIYRMVNNGMLKRTERGVYKFGNLGSIKGSNKTQGLFTNMRLLIDEFNFSVKEATRISDVDLEAIHTLMQIKDMVDEVLYSYGEGVTDNE